MGVPAGPSTVTVDLTAERSGTRLRFVHSGLPEAAAPMHAQGWDNYIARLVTAAQGADPGPDPMRDAAE